MGATPAICRVLRRQRRRSCDSNQMPSVAGLASILLNLSRRPHRLQHLRERHMSSEGFTIDRRQLGLLGLGLAAAAATGVGAIPGVMPQAKAATPKTGPIKVGILHSLSGT